MSQELSSSMEKAPRRALYKAMGLTDEQLEKPLIAVVSAQSELSPETAGLNAVAEAVKAGVYAGGATPLVLHVAGVFGASKYLLPSRELVADSVESLLIGNEFDGAVFVTGNAATTAGMLMGAARVNIPSVFVSGGAMPSGAHAGGKATLSSVVNGVGNVRGGKLNVAELSELEATACPSIGSDGDLSATNALACMLEALGMALGGNGTAPAGSGARIALAKKTGLAVCELVKNADTPKQIMTKSAFFNAVTLAAAIGAPTDVVLHITAIAAEMNVALDLNTISRLSAAAPTLVRLLPAGDADMADMHRAGGVAAVLHELAKLNIIDGSVYTVACRSLAALYDHAHVKDEEVIRKSDAPFCPAGDITAISGNLAENGAVAVRNGLSKTAPVYSGKARCFDREEDAAEAIYSGKLKSGDVLVIRYEGPMSGSGMRDMTSIIPALRGMGLDGKVAVVTDGRISGVSSSAVIRHVSPEAAEGGKLALVKDGDMIKIDIPGGKISLEVAAKELQARQKKLRPKDVNVSGWLLRYQNLVTSAANGAVLKKKF